jgi:uncharacterized protein YciI
VNNYYVLFYESVEEFAARRTAHRAEHLRLLREAHDRGDLVLAGAVGDPPDGGLMVFRTSSPSMAEEFARHDPYVTNGLVTRWRVKPWHVVVGHED